MRLRRKCAQVGHKFRSWAGSPLPVEFCSRWLCEGSRVADWVPPGDMRDALQETVDRQNGASVLFCANGDGRVAVGENTIGVAMIDDIPGVPPEDIPQDGMIEIVELLCAKCLRKKAKQDARDNRREASQ